jgi:hypothetical protein
MATSNLEVEARSDACEKSAFEPLLPPGNRTDEILPVVWISQVH